MLKLNYEINDNLRHDWTMASGSYSSSRLNFIWWKKIPELMKGLGKGMKEFKDATKEIDKDKEKS